METILLSNKEYIRLKNSGKYEVIQILNGDEVIHELGSNFWFKNAGYDINDKHEVLIVDGEQEKEI